MVATCTSPAAGDSGLQPRLHWIGDCGPYLGFTWIWGLQSPSGPHLALLTVVLNWAKLGPVTVIHKWTSPGPGDSGPPLGVTVP